MLLLEKEKKFKVKLEKDKESLPFHIIMSLSECSSFPGLV